MLHSWGGTVLDVSDGATLALMLASAGAAAERGGPLVSLEVSGWGGRGVGGK